MNAKTYLFVLASLAMSAAAQAETDAEAIVQAAAKACKEMKSAQFSVDAKFAGVKVKATIWQVIAPVPDSGFAQGKYRVKGTAEEAGALSFFDISYDGKALRIKGDTDDTEVIEHPTAYQAGQYVPAPAMMASMPLLGERFGSLLANKPNLRLLPQQTVGKWTCDVVEIKRKVSSPVAGDVVVTVAWAFDRETHLPVQRSSATSTVTITKLAINPTIDDKMFRLESKTVAVANPLGPATDQLLALGSAAPKFSLKDPKGRIRSLTGYRGKVLVLDFWGTWCVPCRKTMPILQELHRKYGGREVAVLGVAVDRTYDPAAFMKRMGYSYPIALKGDPVAKAYKVKMLPTIYVIGPDGRIRYRQAGINREDDTRLPKVALGLRKPSRRRS